MPTGRCLCGGLTMSYNDEPAMKALCHCSDCQKISGGAYSVNVVIPEQTFRWDRGTPKEYTKTADSGKKIVSYFCGNCGSTLARKSESFEGMVIIKAGTVDGGIELGKPDAELFTKARGSWVPQAPGTQQMNEMS